MGWWDDLKAKEETEKRLKKQEWEEFTFCHSCRRYTIHRWVKTLQELECEICGTELGAASKTG